MFEELKTIARTIQEILSTPDSALLSMGQRGRKLMEEKYEQHKVAQMMQNLYYWLLNGGEKPEFVFV